MSEKTKNIIIIIVLVIAVFIAYSVLFKKDKGADLLISQSVSGVDAESTVVREFLALLNTLNNLSLDTSIFRDSVFNSLRDESVQLIDEPRGRRNPFAPLEK